MEAIKEIIIVLAFGILGFALARYSRKKHNTEKSRGDDHTFLSEEASVKGIIGSEIKSILTLVGFIVILGLLIAIGQFAGEALNSINLPNWAKKATPMILSVAIIVCILFPIILFVQRRGK